jgi:hypothetical protein
MLFIFLEMLEDEFINGIVKEEYLVAFLRETLEIGRIENCFFGFTCEEIDNFLVFFCSV